MKRASIVRVVLATVFATTALRAEPVAPAAAAPGAENAQTISVSVPADTATNLQPSPKVTQPRPKKGFTIGFAVGGGFSAFRIKEPVGVPVRLESTTTSGGVTSTTTVDDAEWPVTAKGQGPAVVADFRCGVMLTPELAALFDVAFAGVLWKGPEPPAEADGWTITEQQSGKDGLPVQLHVGVSAQAFVAGPLWLRGGFGAGLITYDPNSERDGDEVISGGPSVLASVGIQLSQKWVTDHSNKAPSLELQYLGGPLGTDAYAHGVSLAVGYQWY